MIAVWMIYATVIAFLLWGVGLQLERVAGAGGWPRRIGWAIVASLAVVFAGAVARTPRSPVVVAAGADATRQVAPGRVVVEAAGVPGHATTTMFGRVRQEFERLAATLSPWNALLLWLWGLGTFALAGVWVAGQWQVTRRRRAWVAHNANGITVLLTDDIGPALVGVTRPEIVLPRWAFSLDAGSRALLVRHEDEHRRAHDALLVHVAAVGVALMPWNVAIWSIVRRLRLAVELDCDARVLAAFADRPATDTRYGELLLNVAARRSGHRLQIVPAFLEPKSSLSRRISTMCDQPLAHPRLRGACAGFAAMLLLSAALLMPAPELRAQEPGEPSVVRLIGSPSSSPAPVTARATTRELLSKYFPDVLRGEGPPSIVFLRDPAGRIIGTLPMQSAERIIGFLQAESGAGRGESGYSMEQPSPERGSDGRLTTGYAFLRRETAQRSEHEDTFRVRVHPPNGEPSTLEDRTDRRGETMMVQYRPRFGAEELTIEQRHLAERVVSADLVLHGVGDVGPDAVRVVFLTLRRGA